MLKPVISRSRSDLQLLYHSGLLSRKTGILLNSLPKSGTHFFKALLDGMGYQFHGHFGSRSLLSVHLIQGEPGFYTAHTRRDVTGDGRKFLTIRDPAAVALSQVHYVKKRRDHYLHKAYESLPLEEAIIKTFVGCEQFNPLCRRYESMLLWAERHKASTLDYEDFSTNPEIMACVLGLDSFDKKIVSAKLNKWNPTKRDSDKAEETTFLVNLRIRHRAVMQPCYDIYDRMKALRAYEI